MKKMLTCLFLLFCISVKGYGSAKDLYDKAKIAYSKDDYNNSLSFTEELLNNYPVNDDYLKLYSDLGRRFLYSKRSYDTAKRILTRIIDSHPQS